MESLVVLSGVGASVHGTPVIAQADLALHPGQALAIVGRNGSGKTTLLRLVATLLTPSRGQGKVLGARLGTDEAYPVRHRIGLAGHLPALVESLTLSENLNLFARLHGRPREQVHDCLAAVGLDGAGNRKAGACSAGMKRRADLARLLIHPVELLLLDEPFDTLDDTARPLVNQLIRRTTDLGGAALVVTHDRSNLPEVDQLMELENGVLR